MQQNQTSRICLWLDQDLIQIFKNKNFKLNEELQSFFEYQDQKSNITTEITLDSYPEIQNIIKFFHEFNIQIDNLIEHIDSFNDIILEIGTNVFYDDDDNDEDDGKACDRLSAYYGAFYERPEELEKMKQENELYESLNKHDHNNKVQQIKNFYNLDDIELDNTN